MPVKACAAPLAVPWRILHERDRCMRHRIQDDPAAMASLSVEERAIVQRQVREMEGHGIGAATRARCSRPPPWKAQSHRTIGADEATKAEVIHLLGEAAVLGQEVRAATGRHIQKTCLAQYLGNIEKSRAQSTSTVRRRGAPSLLLLDAPFVCVRRTRLHIGASTTRRSRKTCRCSCGEGTRWSHSSV